MSSTGADVFLPVTAAPAVLLGVQTHPALPQPAGQPAEHVPQLAAAGAVPADAATAANAPTYEIARDIMDGERCCRVARLASPVFMWPETALHDMRMLHAQWREIHGSLVNACLTAQLLLPLLLDSLCRHTE
jgi:hypothetical protein